MNLLSHLDLTQVHELKGRDWPVSSIGRSIEAYSMEQMIRQEAPSIVLISVCETGEETLLKLVRECFYSLYINSKNFMCADAGIFMGNSDELQEALGRIRDYGSIPIVLSPDQSVTYQMYLSYCNREQTVNLLSIDDSPDLNEDIPFPGNSNWLSFVLSHAPNYLFNYALLGYQSYLSNTEMIKTLTDLHFDLHRLGQIRKSVSSTEPLFRNADFVSFDIGAIRASDSDCNISPGPNGLYSEEACQLIRYAGISNKLSMVGIFGWMNSPKLNSITPMLIAQLIWHFIDGILSRSSDGVIGEGDAYTTYKLTSENVHEELVFYKNIFNGRWWMNVPMNDHSKGKYKKHRIVPCAYEDYQQAMKGEIPDTWWQTYQKLM